MTEYASDLSDFKDLLRATADQKRQRTAIVEKDYYLCRALHALSANHAGEFILKGGTSLSKGWNLLDRFSEDLDILVRSEADWGKSKRDTRLKTLRDAITATKSLTLDREDRRTRAETGVSRSAVYRYESLATDVPGLGRNILFEAGYRGSPESSVKRTIQSMVAEYAKDQGQQNLADDLRDFEIELQSLPRTFVEKLFAIHAAYATDLANNKMRHYYDLSRLCGVAEIQSYVGTEAYRACIADVKRICHESFLDQAVPAGDSFKDSPAFQISETFSELERNYKREAEIFFSEPPTLFAIFEAIENVRPRLWFSRVLMSNSLQLNRASRKTPWYPIRGQAYPKRVQGLGYMSRKSLPVAPPQGRDSWGFVRKFWLFDGHIEGVEGVLHPVGLRVLLSVGARG